RLTSPNDACSLILHVALPISFEHVTLISDATMFKGRRRGNIVMIGTQTPLADTALGGPDAFCAALRSEPLPAQASMGNATTNFIDRKSTRLNSSHVSTSYAVF